MTIQLVIVTHGDIGRALVEAAKQTYNGSPLPVTTLSVSSQTDPQKIQHKLSDLFAKFGQTDNILILTDVFGATPCNIVHQMQKGQHIELVSGINLPMLLKVFNYSHLPLTDLIEKAVQGGREGIMQCTPNVATDR